ncbi:hypothetical protein GH714_025524 [Hevea brasiliensis]|uniref:Chromo domain-containing protein n=1 Tax=Hevea brasiliensis TaxID=3981 RepID=A0A6A6K6Z9_HEVBR|nr:hypothetical protein GH714_025524 [Hevea brasiliensis]
MAEGTRAQEWRREMISLLQDFEQRWEQKQSVLQQESETRNNQMMMDIKAMVARLSLQNNELARNRGQSSNTPAGNRNMAVKNEYYFEGYVKIKGPDAYDNWQEYVGSLRARFGKQGYDDPLAELKNLKQTQGLQEYLDTFDALYPKAGVREDQALSFFLSGLIDELQMPVRMFKPQTLAEAYALAKLQEITVAAIQSKPKPAVKTYTSFTSPVNSASNHKNNKPNPKDQPGLLPTPDISKLPVTKKPQELTKWMREVMKEEMLGCEEELVTGQELQMSLNAMRGTPGAHTMCVAGTCGKRSLQVLIDAGSTHNFLDSHIARKVGCELVKVTRVVVKKAHQVSSMQLVSHKEYWNSSQPIQLNALHATVSTWSELQQTLQDYADVFKDLKTLPPSRSHDYRIILKEGATHVNARPYRSTSATVHVSSQLPPLPSLVSDYPQDILDKRIVKRQNSAATQLLIDWKGHSPADATWEFAEEMKLRFPVFFLEDKES